ncbi:hypothetical protein V2J09_007281 [Rumex salicifolius]
MEEGRGLGAGGDSSSSRVAASSYEKQGDRTRFTVELRPGETTIVSWKKLMKDVTKANGPAPSSSLGVAVAAATSAPEIPNAGVHPALESRLAPGQPASNELKDPTAPNRFNSVIEKIERLYMGKDSSDDEELDDVPDDDQYDTEDSFIDDTELDEYFEVDKAKTKHDGFFVNRGKLENIEPSVLPTQQPRKRRRKEMTKAIGESISGHATNNDMKMGRKGADQIAPSTESNISRSPSRINHQKTGVDGKLSIYAVTSLKASNVNFGIVPDKLKEARKISGSGHVRYQEKGGSGHLKTQTGKANNAEQSFQHREKNGNRMLIDLNVSASKYSMKTSQVHKREGSSLKSKSTMLDKAIRDLEKMVAESRPPMMDVQDADATSQAIKRRLSQEIKHKLAKVARVAQVGNGAIPKELLVRLMSILGHLVNVRTLKRNLKIMSSSSFSVSKEKSEKFQQIKKDIVDMIKMYPPTLTSKAAEQQNGSADDFQESREDKGVIKVKYTLHPALEDQICDLYDIFVDGLDEDVAPQVRKLYAEHAPYDVLCHYLVLFLKLAALWSEGVMDNHGIKRAICRSKERRRTVHDRNKEQEIVKRKKLVAQKVEETVQPESTSNAQQQHALLTLASTPTTIPTIMTLALPASPSTNAQNNERPKHEKIKGSSSSSFVEIRTADGTLVKKKHKRKAESDLPEAHLLHKEDRPKSHKQDPNPNIQSTVLPSFQQLT